MSDPGDNGNHNGNGNGGGRFPEDFRGYETTFFGSIGRAQLWGADRNEQAELTDNLYTGWIDSRASYWDRRQARADYYDRMRSLRQRHAQAQGLTFDDRQYSQDPDFDWAQWKEEYSAYQQ